MPPTVKQSVQDALEAYSPLRTSGTEVNVTLEDGVVTLSGYAPSLSIKRMAAVLAGSVESVNGVVNKIIADPELEHAVAMALAQDDRTRQLPIRVRSGLGRVQLQGNVPNEQAAETALEVARKIEGARQVISALDIGSPAQLAA